MIDKARSAERALDRLIARLKTPREFRQALRLVDGTMDGCRYIFEQNEIPYTAADLVALVGLVLKEADRVRTAEPDALEEIEDSDSIVE